MNNVQIKKTDPVFTDQRGSIFDLLDDAIIQHVGIITSKKGTIRGNHYHLKQDQYNYIFSGKVKLLTRNIEGDSKLVESHILVPGDFVSIPTKVIHTMEFLEDTVFLDLNSESRSNDGYEKDTIRVQIQ